MTIYGAAVLDVVGSKKIGRRGELQETLNRVITEFNRAFADILPVPAGITVGDEWELLTDHPARCYELAQWFQQALWTYNVEIYVGLGIGGLSMTPEGEIRQLDGPCFHLARQAVEIAKGSGHIKHKLIHSKRNRLYLLAQAPDVLAGRDRILGLQYEEAATTEHTPDRPQLLPEIANTLIENNEILKARMTKKQRQVILDYQKYGSYREVAAGSEKRQTLGGISQKLNSAEYFTIQRNEKLLGILLDMMAKGEPWR